MPVIQHIQLTQSIGEQLKVKGLLTPETSQLQNDKSITRNSTSNIRPWYIDRKDIDFWNAGLRSLQVTTGLVEEKTLGTKILFKEKGLGIDENKGGLIPESINYGKTLDASQLQNSINALNNSFLNPYNKDINFWNAGLDSVQVATGFSGKVEAQLQMKK